MVYGVWTASWRKWDDVGCFAKGVLGGIDSSYTDVEGGTTIAAGDNHWFSEMLAQGLEDGFAELLEDRNVLGRTTVVDAVGGCGG